MTEADVLDDLARALRANPMWEWVPGMLVHAFPGVAFRVGEKWGTPFLEHGDPVVQLGDPATAGCLLYLLAKADKGPDVSIPFVDAVDWHTGTPDPWFVEIWETGVDYPRFEGSSLGEAVAKALLAAWEAT